MGFECTNLTDANVVRRLRVGIGTLAFGLLSAVFLKATGASPSIRLLVFVPLFIATNTFFQAMYMNCGYSALSGMRHTEVGRERIADRGELRSVRARGLKQIALAFVFAAALTWLFLIL